jgi:predicted dehydrogenase
VYRGLKTYTLAVIGGGTVAESHLEAYARLDCVRLIGLAEPRTRRRQELSERYGLPGYASYAELLEGLRPDVACILTPVATHRRITEQCAAAGVHVLCEKPMATTLEDARAMAEVCLGSGVRFFYGSSYRFLPAVVEARLRIAAGEIGEVRLILEEVIGGNGAAAYQPMSAAHYPVGGPGGGGYGLVDHGIHMLDVLPWLCESPISAVFGCGDKSGAVACPEVAWLSLASGARGVLIYDQSSRPLELPAEGMFSGARSWVEERGWVGDSGAWDAHPGQIRVFGSEGALRIFHYANKLLINRSGQLNSLPLPDATAPWHFGTQMRQFCQNLERGEAPAISADDGIRALKALLAIYESERSGGWRAVQTN